MKFKNLIIAGIAVATLASCNNAASNSDALNTKTDSISYLLGASDGFGLKQNFSIIDTIIDINNYLDAFDDCTKGKTLRVTTDSTSMEVIQLFMTQLQSYIMQRQNDTTATPAPLTKSLRDSICYMMGVLDYNSVKESSDSLKSKFNIIVDTRKYNMGLHDIFNDSLKIKLNNPRTQILLTEFTTNVRNLSMEEQFGDYKKENEDFLANNALNDSIVTTESGVQYKVITEGTGEKPVVGNTIKVHYTGKVIDGTIFDSSVDGEDAEPVEFELSSNLIKGWVEALPLMSVGSKWEIYIPQELGYGANGVPNSPIKPFSTLIFEIELLDIVK